MPENRERSRAFLYLRRALTYMSGESMERVNNGLGDDRYYAVGVTWDVLMEDEGKKYVVDGSGGVREVSED